MDPSLLVIFILFDQGSVAFFVHLSTSHYSYFLIRYIFQISQYLLEEKNLLNFKFKLVIAVFLYTFYVDDFDQDYSATN